MSMVSENIKALQENSGLTQEKFGEMHGVNPKTAWSYISGRTNPDAMFLLSVLEHYSLPASFIEKKKLKFNASGEIINRPNKDQRISTLKAKAELLIVEMQNNAKRYQAEIEKIIREMKQLSKK